MCFGTGVTFFGKKDLALLEFSPNGTIDRGGFVHFLPPLQLLRTASICGNGFAVRDPLIYRCTADSIYCVVICTRCMD